MAFYSFMYLLSFFPPDLILCYSDALALREAINQGLMGCNWRQAGPHIRGDGVSGWQTYSRESPGDLRGGGLEVEVISDSSSIILIPAMSCINQRG